MTASATPAATRPALELDDLAGRAAGEVAAALASNLDRGLSAPEAAARLARYGPNEPAPLTGPSWPRILLRQFTSVLILLLLPATLVSALLGEWLNAAAIGITVVVSAAFGFLQEYRSERAIAALHRLTARRAEVLRDGLREEIPAAAIVPGDVIVLADGDVVPADARVIESRGLLVNESILTGEPEAAPKTDSPAPAAEGATAATIVHAGTTVAAGGGLALAVATGPRTALGSIAAAMQAAERRATPLEARLEQLGRRLLVVFLALCVLLVLLGIAQGRDPRDVIEMAVSLAVGAVPEGLPAVATTALAIAVRRLAARRVLVRRLDAVETLGSTTVIVTDKTGTLTENRMTVRRVLLPDGREFHVRVDAADDDLRTVITAEQGTLSAEDEARARRVLLVAALCNDAVVEHDGDHGWHTHGDPSEGALALAAAGLGLGSASLRDRYPRLATEPFTTATRMMRTTHAAPEGGTLTAVKGAYEQVAALDRLAHPQLAEAVHALSADGYRLLAVAESSEKGPVRLVGAVVLEDPLRADAALAVGDSRAAGIRVMLVTGDQLPTAVNIARQVGLLGDGDTAVRGADLDLTHLDRVAVVARATHTQKEAIVLALQRRGEVVAMTGDGVNDATALRSADVGVAIGPGATDVAVEAAHIVVADGRLHSLVHGIREGRQISRSLVQAIVYLLTASFGTILLIALGMAASDKLPLGPLQILWLNLVVHVFPALALAISREPDADSDRPTRALLTNLTWLEVAWRSATVAAAGLAALLLGERSGESLSHNQTLVYLALASALLGQAFLIGVESPRAQAARLRTLVLWGGEMISLTLLIAAVYLPGLHAALGLQAAQPHDWATGLVVVAVAWALGQIGVTLLRRMVRDGDRAIPDGGMR